MGAGGGRFEGEGVGVLPGFGGFGVQNRQLRKLKEANALKALCAQFIQVYQAGGNFGIRIYWAPHGGDWRKWR